MTFIELVLVALSCVVTQPALSPCLAEVAAPQVASAHVAAPVFNDTSVDVVLSAQAAEVWDVQTQRVLYQKNADVRRPIASLTKLLSVLVLRDHLSPSSLIEIPSAVIPIQRSGADIDLPVGQHVTATDLFAASLIASANDAIVALADAVADSEIKFTELTNVYAQQHNFQNTRVANATGLSGGEQYSTASDVRRLLTNVYADELLRPFLSQQIGELTTQEGSRRHFKTTNKLLGTYLPIVAAKTGYTPEAGENLVLLTTGKQGQMIGAVILGSSDRFQDMKALVEWIWRNYTWMQ